MQHGTVGDTTTQPRIRIRVAPLRGWTCLWVGLVLFPLSGCVSPWEKSALMKDTYPNIERVQGPTERRLRNFFWAKRQDAAEEESDSLKPIAGTEAYLAATELYKDEQYSDAQKAFKSVAKKYKKSQIREDALFMQAEAAFQQERYSKAHDVYAVLLKEYPSTRHMDTVSERLFKIGKIWLNFPEVAQLSEIEQVNYEDPKRKLPAEEPPKKQGGWVFVPNFTDKHRPAFDTPGNGVAALKAIWMNDVTSPLADDAMMLVASHYAREGNYIESDRYFRMLRETFPNSPHLQEAFVLGSHVKLMSYQGAEYDGKTLADAEMLKKSTVHLYPNIAEADRLKDELAKIEAAKAERDWAQMELWLRKGNKRAAAVMCHQLISHYPESSRARQAAEKLESMGPEYVSGAVLLNPKDPAKPPLWRRALGLQAANPGPTPRPAAPAVDKPYADEESKEQTPSRLIPNPFRKRPAAPTDPFEDGGEKERDESDDAEMDAEEKETPKKRNWLWPIPRRLPDDAESGARKLEASDSTGHSKL